MGAELQPFRLQIPEKKACMDPEGLLLEIEGDQIIFLLEAGRQAWQELVGNSLDANAQVGGQHHKPRRTRAPADSQLQQGECGTLLTD